MSVATPELDAAAHGPGVLLPMPPPTDADGRPALRLLPAPSCEPPYDDEAPPHSHVPPSARRLPGVAGSTALATAPPAEAVVLRLVPSPIGAPALDDDEDDEPARTPLARLPASRPFAHALVQRLLEVLAGLRPLSQLQRDTSFELYTELEQELTGGPRPAGPRPSRRDVRSVHVQEHEQGVAEVCATVRRGGRVTALALRLEGVDGAWRCTALLGL